MTFFVFIFIFIFFCQRTLIFPLIRNRKNRLHRTPQKAIHKYLMGHTWLMPELSSPEWRYILMESEFGSTAKSANKCYYTHTHTYIERESIYSLYCICVCICIYIYSYVHMCVWSDSDPDHFPLSEPPSSPTSIKQQKLLTDVPLPIPYHIVHSQNSKVSHKNCSCSVQNPPMSPHFIQNESSSTCNVLLGSGCWLSTWSITNLILLPLTGKSVPKNIMSSRSLNTNIHISS